MCPPPSLRAAPKGAFRKSPGGTSDSATARAALRGVFLAEIHGARSGHFYALRVKRQSGLLLFAMLQSRSFCRYRLSVILGRRRSDHMVLKVCGILYHQYVDPRIKGAFLRFNSYFSRIMHRVTLFIGLRGPLAADPTAGMLHVLLATLAVWLAAAWVATIPFARKLPTVFPIRSSRKHELRHRTRRAAPARPLSARQSGVPDGHLDLCDTHLLFRWWYTQPGSAALRVLASLRGLAPRLHGRHMDSGWVSAQRAGIYGSGDYAHESSAPDQDNAIGNLVRYRTSRRDQRHPGGADHRQAPRKSAASYLACIGVGGQPGRSTLTCLLTL